MDRRTFLKTSTGAVLSSLVTKAVFAGAAERSLRKIGVQLYTVRSLMEKDFKGTLAKVAAAGYQEVEFAGYYEHQPKDIKKLLNRLGLKAPSTHQGLAVFEQKMDWLIETAKIIGHEYVVCPWLAPEQRSTIDHYKKLAASFNQFGETCQKAGLQFAYHNHDFEFTPITGQLPFDVLLAETDPKLVQIEIDLYWITKAGYDPLAYFAKYPGRFALCHVKDMAADQNIVEVGQGQINFAKIFAQSQQAGLQHYFVEHDQPENPLQSITASSQYLQALKF